MTETSSFRPLSERLRSERPVSDRLFRERPASDHLANDYPANDYPASDHRAGESLPREHPTSDSLSDERPASDRLRRERPTSDRLPRERPTSDRLASERLETERPESDRLGADRLGADHRDADRLGADRLGADRLGADHLGADHRDADRLGAERLMNERSVNETGSFRSVTNTGAIPAVQSDQLRVSPPRTYHRQPTVPEHRLDLPTPPGRHQEPAARTPAPRPTVSEGLHEERAPSPDETTTSLTGREIRSHSKKGKQSKRDDDRTSTQELDRLLGFFDEIRRAKAWDEDPNSSEQQRSDAPPKGRRSRH